VVWVYNIIWMFAQDVVKKITYMIIEHRAGHQISFLRRMALSMHHHSLRNKR
jgi:hypothetical protein